ncbi:unnamed protein product [Linum trigynum]
MHESPGQPQSRHFRTPPREEDPLEQVIVQRKPSPRGFHVSRSPALKVGRTSRPMRAHTDNAVRGLTSPRQTEKRQEGAGGRAERQRQQPLHPDAAVVRPELVHVGEEDPPQPEERRVGRLVSTEPYRRRLILEAMEDDFEPPLPINNEPGSLAEGAKKVRGRKLGKVGVTRKLGANSQEKATTRPGRKQKGPVSYLQEEEVAAASLVNPPPGGKKKGKGKSKVVPSATVDLNFAMGGSMGDEGMTVGDDQKGEGHALSDEALSEEDASRFVIKERRLPSEKEQLVQPGQVKQVVDAFEEGLVINEMKGKLEGVMEEKALKINEYGSNLEGGNRKRSLEELEGVSADSPNPKRQFVEEQAETVNAELVEEASQEWPQADK